MKNAKRFLSLLLCLVMLVGLLPAGVLQATAAESETIYVLAGSDFQPTDSNTATGQALVSAILDKIEAKYTSFDGFLFGGDYNYDYDEAGSIAGKQALQKTVQSYFGTEMDEVYIQGNHDVDSLVGSTLSASGENDPASGGYGVFVINEKDYMWNNDDQATIQATAASLENYLTDKYEEGFDAPIFVVSHLPLHYCLRTQVGGGDGKYAKYIFDVLQAAGDKGLNIIFMYGHNHSHGWDDYLGGAAVYLGVGDSINIAQEGSTTNYDAYNLNFTYMNAGFVSYYRDVNEGAYTGLTMTVFAITDGEVTVERYSATGQVNLKAAGVLNTAHTTNPNTCDSCDDVGVETYEADASVVASATITLNQVAGVDPVTKGDVTVIAEGLADLTVGEVTSAYNMASNTHTATYSNISPLLDDGTGYEGEATVKISLPAQFAEASLSQLNITGGTPKSLENGLLTLTVDTWPANITVSYDVDAAAATVTYEQVTSADGLISGEEYLIIYTSDDRFLSLETVSKNDGREGLALVAGDPDLSNMPQSTLNVGISAYAAYEWTFTATGSQWYIGDGTQNVAFYTDSTGRYGLKLADTGTALTITDNGNGTFGFSGTYSGTKYFNYNSTGDFINGYSSGPAAFYIYRKAETQTETLLNGTWVSITEAAEAGKQYVLVTDGTITDGNYLLVNTDADGRGYAAIAVGETATVTISGGIIASVDSSAVFTLNADGSKVSIYSNADGVYLYPSAAYNRNRWVYSLAESTSESFTNWAKSGTGFQFSLPYSTSSWNSSQTTTAYMVYSSGLSTSATAGSLYLYKEVEKEAATGEYAMLENQLISTFLVGQNEEAMWTQIRENLVIYTSENADGSDATLLTDKSLVTFGPDTIDTDEAGTTVVTVYYNGVAIGKTAVIIQEKRAESIEVFPMEGILILGESVVSDCAITVTYDDGTVEVIDLQVDYLSGKLNVKKAGTYTDLTVTYGGRVVEGFTLHVVDNRPAFPNYPSPGSVLLDKTAIGVDFQETGLTRVELTTSGLNAPVGIDVVVVVDTSSSMNDNKVDGSDKSRLQVLSESLEDLLIALQTPNATTGEVADIDLAVITFNGYDNQIDGATLDGTYRTNADNSKIMTGLWASESGTSISALYNQGHSLNEESFEAATDVNASVIAEAMLDATSSGTNYDAALANAYQLLSAKKAANINEREQFLIFLSDGAPFRYNGFNQAGKADTTDGNYAEWAEWLDGKWTDSSQIPADYQGDDFYHFYNGNGTTHPHRIAEAIKGTPGTYYDVVHPLYPDTDYITQYEGLGATIYSIGFGLAADEDVTEAIQKELIEVISSGTGYAYPDVNTAEELSNAFNQIAASISYAATDAVFEDQLGDAYDLQITPVAGYDNSITITAQDLYTRGDLALNLCTADQVGTVKGSPTVLETVSFSTDEDGNVIATSSVLSGNIFQNGVIQASTFCYNATSLPVVVTVNGEDYTLPGETFVWNIGTIDEQQLTLSYLVYLNGALGENGGLSAGSYSTNNYARLTYTNYLGNQVSQTVASPTMAWKSANVSYSFYLVDENGNPLLADGSRADNFLQAYKVTQPVVYKEMNLNTDAETILAAVASDVLPEGYDLYDADASYTIKITSNGEGSYWQIVSGKDVATTYVMGYAGASDYSNELKMEDNDADYTHTTVYFAVEWVIGTVPDTVVVDFGLPVDIDVLANDMLGANGQLVGIGQAVSDYDSVHSTQQTRLTEYPYGKYGMISVDTVKGTIRFTPADADFPASEEFAYEVKYADGMYYYGKLTIIPATSIYFEESFLNYHTYDNETGEEITSTWEAPAPDADTDTQDQDRPGVYNLPTLDANNVYGYDSAYDNMTTLSMDGAAKITVDNTTFGMAAFSFSGTGFDIISLTSSDTGLIMVDLYDADNKYLTSYFVDTYYGYSYVDGEWVADPGENALYQVPVIKVAGLDYGTYNVQIIVAYNDLLDHNKNDASYDFYLDAIRIYDPANNGVSDQAVRDAYLADGECWPTYLELRSHLIDSDSFNSDSDTYANGIVYIDGMNEASISDYTSYGPNNELYLKPGAAVAFKLEKQANIANVHISVKSADGKPLTARLYNVITTDNGPVIVNDASKNIATATEMYYAANSQLNNGDTYIIVLQNLSTSEGILSVTNIKFTYASDPAAAAVAFAAFTEEDADVAIRSLAVRYEAPKVEITDEDTTTDDTVTDDTAKDDAAADDSVAAPDNSDTVGTPDADAGDVQEPAEDADDSQTPAEDEAEAPAEDEPEAEEPEAPAQDEAEDEGSDNTAAIVAIVAACVVLCAAVLAILIKKNKGGK